MSDTPSRDDSAGIDDLIGSGMHGQPAEPRPRRKRRGLRIALVSLASLVVLLGGVVAGGFVLVNNLASSVHRIPGVFTKLDAAVAPEGGPPGHALTVLITGSDTVAHSGHVQSGLYAILRINAAHTAGSVVNIPPNSVVNIPGHGRHLLQNAMPMGGPPLLIATVEKLTHVRINHYGVIAFPHVTSVVNALNGVNVDLPHAVTSFGHTFHAGINHLNGTTALYYARQHYSVPNSEELRVLRQSSLIRAILKKIANHNLLSNPLTAYRVIHAFTQALSVDSNFTNRELESLALALRHLGSNAGTFVTAPTHGSAIVDGQSAVFLKHRESRKLWKAISTDSVAAFAKRYPATVTPSAPR
ncbi:MAG TPA: LCP family protein [Streptosporangiaceae bacterium]|jgi:LCP family protein required for cell wall assembly|nr:LCP family protein [Streptosporangiaceae bacterium]